MPGPPDDPSRQEPAWPWTSDRPGNPRTFPSRLAATVTLEVQAAARQHQELEAMMATSGQTGALVVATLDAVALSTGGACTTTTWAEGPITVLPQADVIALFALPASLDHQPTVTHVRFDVVARVCAVGCWSLVAGIDPPRFITRRWPDEAELAILRGLSLPAPA